MSYSVKIKNTSVIGEQIHLGHPKARFAPVITDATIEKCEVTIQGDLRSVILRSEFRDCAIKCINASFMVHSIKLFNCRFEGLIKDAVIGSPPIEEFNTPPDIRQCDFSNLNMRLVDFRDGLKPETCSWPKWPFIRFERTNENRKELKQLEIPEKVSRLISFKCLGEKSHTVIDISQYDCDLEKVHEVLKDCKHAHFA